MKRKTLLEIVGAGVLALAGSCYLLRCESSPLRKWYINNYASWAEPGVMEQLTKDLPFISYRPSTREADYKNK